MTNIKPFLYKYRILLVLSICIITWLLILLHYIYKLKKSIFIVDKKWLKINRHFVIFGQKIAMKEFPAKLCQTWLKIWMEKKHEKRYYEGLQKPTYTNLDAVVSWFALLKRKRLRCDAKVREDTHLLSVATTNCLCC